MRAPLSWLRDFAPFPDDVGSLRAALDDLGLVVEAIEHVGEGLGDVVVGRVLEIRPSRAPTRSASSSSTPGRSRSRSCAGATTSRWGTGCRSRRSGAILPGGFEISQRKMRGVVSNGMLCSGKELGLTDDGAGLLILGDEAPGEPGTPLMEALGLEPDTVFDITVEGNRPDAWCMVGDRPRPGGAPRPAVHRCPSRPTRRRAGGRSRRPRRRRSSRPTCAPASR